MPHLQKPMTSILKYIFGDAETNVNPMVVDRRYFDDNSPQGRNLDKDMFYPVIDYRFNYDAPETTRGDLSPSPDGHTDGLLEEEGRLRTLAPCDPGRINQIQHINEYTRSENDQLLHGMFAIVSCKPGYSPDHVGEWRLPSRGSETQSRFFRVQCKEDGQIKMPDNRPIVCIKDGL